LAGVRSVAAARELSGERFARCGAYAEARTSPADRSLQGELLGTALACGKEAFLKVCHAKTPAKVAGGGERVAEQVEGDPRWGEEDSALAISAVHPGFDQETKMKYFAHNIKAWIIAGAVAVKFSSTARRNLDGSEVEAFARQVKGDLSEGSAEGERLRECVKMSVAKMAEMGHGKVFMGGWLEETLIEAVQAGKCGKVTSVEEM